jgi:tRNA (guanine37-N1)-methyltransferase
MEKYDAATEYLIKDRLTNCGLLQMLRRESADVLEAGEDGVLLFDRISGAYMASADDSEKAITWMQGLKDVSLISTTDAAVAAAARQLWKFKKFFDCEQAVYCSDSPLRYEKRLAIDEISDAEMSAVYENYDTISRTDIDMIRAAHGLYAGRDGNGRLAGFIGIHTEGSIGLLFVLPGQRRKGYAEELESFMINKMLSHDLYAFGQVETGNAASAKLQEKLGLKTAQKHVYWLSERRRTK